MSSKSRKQDEACCWRVSYHVQIDIPLFMFTVANLNKLKDPSVLETFQTMTGGKFASLTIMINEDADLHSMITTFNTAVTETAREILGKHRHKKKPWITAEILDLCDKRRELRKKRFEPEGSEKYKEVINNIKRCMKNG